MRPRHFWIALGTIVAIAAVFWYEIFGWAHFVKAPPDPPKPAFCYDLDLVCRMENPGITLRPGCPDENRLGFWTECPKATHPRPRRKP